MSKMSESGANDALTTEQLAEAGAASSGASPVQQAAADPRERDAAGMPVDRPDQVPHDRAAMEMDARDTDAMQSDGMQTDAMQTDAMQTDEASRQMQAGEPRPGSATGGAQSSDGAELLQPTDRDDMTRRWRDIQADFVDHPRQAMKDADTLVAGLMQQLAQTFARERSQLEAQWSRGDEVSTEDLRVSLQRYRAFFERLLSV
jgi:hypothetical protein